MVIKRFEAKAKVEHFLIVSMNISSGVTQKYSKNKTNAKKHRNRGSSPNTPQNPNSERSHNGVFYAAERRTVLNVMEMAIEKLEAKVNKYEKNMAIQNEFVKSKLCL